MLLRQWPAPSSSRVLLAELFAPERPLVLASGQVLDSVQVAYETYGRPDGTGGNTVFVCHALTGDSHAARHHPDDLPGWWEPMVGPGRPIDTDRYHVVCANVLGGCAGTTGPWVPGRDGRPLGHAFPEISVADMVAVHRELLARLGITRLRAVIGGSLGGMQSLEWLLSHPDDADGFLLIAATARQSADNLAWNAIARHAIRTGGPHSGLAVARMIAHLTYLSGPVLDRKFGRGLRRVGTRTHHSLALQGDFAVEGHLEHQAVKFLHRFDAGSYLQLTSAMDRFDPFDEGRRIPARGPLPSARLFSFGRDRLFGPEHSERIQLELAARGLPAIHVRDEASDAGHHAFLLDTPGFLAAVDAYLRRLDRAPAQPAPLANR